MSDNDANPVLERLDELVRIAREGAMGDRYLDTHGVAAFLGYSYTYTRDVIVHKPGFPKAGRLGGRWLKSDVAKWARGSS